MSIPRKKLCWLLSIGIGLLLLIIISSQFVAIGWGLHLAGGCISISLDKWDVKQVDRVVIQAHGKSAEITDPELIDRLIDEMLVAKQADFRFSTPKEPQYIEFYKGDELVRHMAWGGLEDRLVKLYEADSRHFLFLCYSDTGLADLPRDLVEELFSLLE